MRNSVPGSELLYLDHAAAAPTPERVREFYCRRLADSFANQEAGHSGGYALRRKLEEAACRVAECAGDRQMKFVPAGSGTEAIAQLLSLKRFRVPGGNIVTDRLAHPALAAALRRTGQELRFVRCDRSGAWETGHLESLADARTTLVAVSAVQSELGSTQEIDRIAGVVKNACHASALLLVDSIQAAGKLPLPVLEADFLLLSGHKFGSPGGGGILISERVAGRDELLSSLAGLRRLEYLAGRPEAALQLTMGYAFELATAEMAANLSHVWKLNGSLRSFLAEDAEVRERVTPTLSADRSSPYILHLRLKKLDGGVLVRMFSERGVLLSAGSACRSETRDPSAAMLALGYGREQSFDVLRVSMGPGTTETELEKFKKALKDVIFSY